MQGSYTVTVTVFGENDGAAVYSASISLAGDALTPDIACDVFGGETFTCMIAQYNDIGLTDVCLGGDEDAVPVSEGVTVAKLFILRGFGNMQPLCGAYTLALSGGEMENN